MSEIDPKQALAITDYKPLKNEIAIQGAGSGRGRQLAPENATQAMTFAQMMARADKAIPEHLRNNVGMCLAVTLDAMSFGFNPIALARGSYAVGNTLSYEAKVYAAALNTSGYLRTRPKISYTGEVSGMHKVKAKEGTRDAPSGDLVCTISAFIVGEEEIKEWSSPKLSEITTKNSPLWYSDPKLQLYYYTMRAWARIHLPEVMLGVQTRDEVDDMGPVIDNASEPEAPKQTLIDRVKARRAEAAEPTDVGTIAEAFAVEPAAAEHVETVDFVDVAPEESAPAETAPAAETEPVAETQEVAVTEDPLPEAAQETAPAARTIKDAIADIKKKSGEAESVDDLDKTHADWLWTITEFTKEEQFDLQAEGDLIVAKRRVAIRKGMREKK